MAEKRRAKAARSKEEIKEAVVRSPLLVRSAESAMRFLLGWVLAGGEIFGGFSPFGVGLAASAGSGLDGLMATLGAALGYLTLRGLTEGLRYAAACVLTFSVAFAFYDIRIYKKGWFMPFISAGMTAVTGFVYLSDARWTPAQAVFFVTEILLAGASAYFYRLAFSPWQSPREELLDTRQAVSLLFLLGTLLISLGGLTFFGDLSMGRVLSVALVMAVAHGVWSCRRGRSGDGNGPGNRGGDGFLRHGLWAFRTADGGGLEAEPALWSDQLHSCQRGGGALDLGRGAPGLRPL